MLRLRNHPVEVYYPDGFHETGDQVKMGYLITTGAMQYQLQTKDKRKVANSEFAWLDVVADYGTRIILKKRYGNTRFPPHLNFEPFEPNIHWQDPPLRGEGFTMPSYNDRQSARDWTVPPINFDGENINNHAPLVRSASNGDGLGCVGWMIVIGVLLMIVAAMGG